MIRSALVGLVAVVGCSNSAPKSDFLSPVDAARCQTESIRKQSVLRWHSCGHPDFLGANTLAEWEAAARKVGFWDEMRTKNAILEGARESDFTLAPARDTRYGDQVATFPMGPGDSPDKFEAWRKDGRWYIVDTGL